MESNVCVDNSPYIRTKAASTAVSGLLAAELCAGRSDVMACLREKSSSELISWGSTVGPMGAPWTPIVEGEVGGVLPDTPENLIASGNYNKAPFIVGSNSNEVGLFSALFPKLNTVAELEQAIEMLLPNDAAGAAAIRAQYAGVSDAAANDAFLRISTDIAWRCPVRKLARIASDKGSKVYLYNFQEGNAYHSDELTYVFGFDNGGLGGESPSPSLIAAVQSYWTRFAGSTDPNGGSDPHWPVYETATDQHMALKTPLEAGSHLSTSDCDFWDQHDDIAAELVKDALGGPTGM
jgi:para-nitrobenzyl esterase